MGVKVDELYYSADEDLYYCQSSTGEWYEIDLLETWDVAPGGLELLWKRDFGAEVAKLKDGSVVRAKGGLVFERYHGSWFTPGRATEYYDHDIASYGGGDILLEVK